MVNKSRYLELRIQGEVRKFLWGGFTSEMNNHKHYMKHVARVNEMSDEEKKDPERWNELWPDNPELPRVLDRRRHETKKRLKSTLPRCPLANKAPAKKNICKDCFQYGGSEKAIEAVGASFEKELSVYEGILYEAISSALQCKSPGSKRCFYVEREPMREKLSIVALSQDRVFVVALINERTGVCKAKTGYRPAYGRRLRSFRELIYDFHLKRQAIIASKRMVESSPKDE